MAGGPFPIPLIEPDVRGYRIRLSELAELGDLAPFRSPRELVGYLGLVPSKSSTGDTVKRGGITKAGNGRARGILVEAASSYRYPPRASREKQPKEGPAANGVSFSDNQTPCVRARPF